MTSSSTGPTPRIIDCDADPHIPQSWTIEEHQKGGQIDLTSLKIRLFLTHAQQKGERIFGSDIRRLLRRRKVLNACVLDHYLAHKDDIPEELEREVDAHDGLTIFFWGTIYHGFDKQCYVRCLLKRAGEWVEDFRWVDFWWDATLPAAIEED